MSSQKKHIPIGGSERAPFEQAREVGPADPKEKIDVTLRLRSRIGTKKIVPDNVFRQPLEKRKILSRQTFEQKYGALSDDVAKVEAFALEHQLTVREKSAARRTIVLSGTVATIGAAFEIKLKEYEHVAGNYRGYTGQIQIPADLSNIIEGVFGLDNRPQAKPHFRRRREQTLVHAASTTLSYTPTQVASLYQFPTGLDGSGECIALIELGGGYTPADLDSYWRLLNLKAIPNVSAVSIGDANNSPTGDPNGPDGEVTLDIEVAGAIAPGAKIVVYFLKHKILVVDDEPALRNSLEMLLNASGYDVSLAVDGFEALLQLRTCVPAIVISDLNMPHMSGFELLSVLRRRFPQIAVIATSGAYDCGDAVPGGVIADAFYPKGKSSPGALLKLVAALIPASTKRIQAHQLESAPVWIPRNGKDTNGIPYIVLTCTECLRSFPLSVLEENLQRIQETPCLFCANTVRYIIDFSLSVASPDSETAKKTSLSRAKKVAV